MIDYYSIFQEVAKIKQRLERNFSFDTLKLTPEHLVKNMYPNTITYYIKINLYEYGAHFNFKKRRLIISKIEDRWLKDVPISGVSFYDLEFILQVIE